jgi:hypothetical protein
MGQAIGRARAVRAFGTTHRRWLLAIALAVGVAACADQSPMLFQSRPTPALCITYYQSNSDPGYSEDNLIAIHKILDNRNAVDPGDWDLVERHQLKNGMRACAVLAVLGEPFTTVDKGPVETMTFVGKGVAQFKDDRLISFMPTAKK